MKILKVPDTASAAGFCFSERFGEFYKNPNSILSFDLNFKTPTNTYNIKA